jgi:hypothetical protein
MQSFGRGLLNTFKTTLHLANLYLKVPATFGVISIFSSQKDAKNIEHGITPGHKNVHFVREESEQYQQQACSTDPKALNESKQDIKVDGDINKVALDPRVPDKVDCLSTEMAPEQKAELLAFLDKKTTMFLHGQPPTLLE